MKSAINLLFFLFLSISVVAQATKTQTANLGKPHSSFKAVLVVGHSQGQTESSIKSMNKIAEFFKEKGIKTFCFYDTAAKWQDISKVAKGAHFFIYNGHGTQGGGLRIEQGGYTKDILELPLAKNAIVGFQSVCFGAGSSAGDDEEITIDEAAKRVNWYAEPFLKAGAGCYYANNWDDGVLFFLRKLFDGGVCFEEYLKVGEVMQYNSDTTKKIGLTPNNLRGIVTRTSYTNGVKTVKTVPRHKRFDIAWVASPSFSIKNVGVR